MKLSMRLAKLEHLTCSLLEPEMADDLSKARAEHKRYVLHTIKLRDGLSKNVTIEEFEREVQLRLSEAGFSKARDDYELRSLSLKLHDMTVRLEAEEAEALVDTTPPSSWLLAMLLPTTVSDDFITNMEELYATNWLPRYGARKARLIWISQSIQMISKTWMSPVIGLIETVKKLAIG